MRIIAVEEKDIKALMEKLELEKFKLTTNQVFAIDEMHRHFHYVVCSWVQEHGSGYPNN